MPRSGGHSPAQLTSFLSALGVPEAASSVLFHLCYVAHCFVVLAVMPEGLKSAVFSPLATTLYLMLPMFNGADVVFRNVLVPIAGQREALLLKDAKTLAKSMIKQLPASRHGEAGEAIAEAFLVEAKMQK